MNPHHTKELLDRAADSVTPAETDPAARLVGLGRRSVRRRRAWGAAGSVLAAAAVAVVMALPQVTAYRDRSEAAAAPGPAVSLGGLSVAVPDGWRTSTVGTFNPCAAEPHTVYLATDWGTYRSLALTSEASGGPPPRCEPTGEAWIAVVRNGVAPLVSPGRVVVKDRQPIQVDQPDRYGLPSVWTYRALTDEVQATTAFISGDERLLGRVTWPDGPAAPSSGGLVLPDHVTSATSEVPPSNGIVVATDAETLTRIRTALAELRDPVPAGEECTLQKPGSVGIAFGDVTVVLGDASCPQAISTGGGRVRIPAGLGQELLDLVAATDRAATERATGD